MVNAVGAQLEPWSAISSAVELATALLRMPILLHMQLSCASAAPCCACEADGAMSNVQAYFATTDMRTHKTYP